MTPTQRAAALRLIEFGTLPRRLLDIACRVRVNECLFHDDEFVDDASHALKEAIDLLRELAAEPVVNQQMTTEPAVEPGFEYKRGYEEALNDCIRNGMAWARSMFANNAEHIEPVQEPVAAELPAPQLLVESAQGFVEGWTRSQVRSAINLALLKRRYAAPQQPMRCPEDGGACGAGGYCRPEPQDSGWLEAAIAWEVCASIHREYATGKDPFFTTRQSDFVKHADHARTQNKLYAAPKQQRKPLTPSMQAEVECDCLVTWNASTYGHSAQDTVHPMFLSAFLSGYRAAERAHGITGEPT